MRVNAGGLLDLVGLRHTSGPHRFICPPAAVLRHAGATQRFRLGENEAAPKGGRAFGEHESLHALGPHEPRAIEKARRIIGPVGRRPEIPAATKMLADGTKKRILSNVAGQSRRLLDSTAATYAIAVEVEVVEETGQAKSQRLALIADESQDLCERSRTDRETGLLGHRRPSTRRSWC